ncbi:hypothetical protein BN946_scf184594.g13 [Trametes cinnabarina]|uniref:HTH CENPB-type domain-containing protein n=1 Tax=Pycnoporus cinnabarinus TaxID=5643 RepID=A0A060SRX9_PYCCI|nr:hypothetical protein BN946_scf184594.g13 [Trametes cinnabarina]
MSSTHCKGKTRSRTQQIRKYSEETLQEALAHLKSTPGVSRRSVAAQYGIPESTLWERHKQQHSSLCASHAAQQLLTPEEEEAVCDWIEHLSHEGMPVDQHMLLNMASAITGDSQLPNKKWVRRFLTRHPQIRLGKPYGLAPERARAFNRSNVADYFKRLKAVIEQYNIPWSHIYNMDEKGMQRGGKGQIKHNKYLVPRSQQTSYKLRSSDLQLMTIIECVCANGSAIQPTFIFAGKGFTHDMFEGVDPDVCIAHSPNGWTQNTICVEWFKHSFIPQTKARRVSDVPILLIVDGHRSHVTAEMLRLAIQNNIHIFLLPPHCTHRIQPLDVGVFNALQSAWHVHMNRFFRISRGEKMDHGEFIHEYLALRNRLFTPHLICSAWRASGITTGQFSADVFSEHDYAPSRVSSVTAHVPPSYPTKHPLFPEHASSHPTDQPPELPCTSSSDSRNPKTPAPLDEDYLAAASESGSDLSDSDLEVDTALDSDERPANPSQPWTQTHCASPGVFTAEERAQLRRRACSLEQARTLSAVAESEDSSQVHQCVKPCSDCQDHIANLRRRVAMLEHDMRDLYSWSWHVEAHSKLAEVRISDLQQQLQYAEAKRHRRKRSLRTTAMLLTAGEGLALSQQQEEEARAEAERHAAEQACKDREEAERHALRIHNACNESYVFSGTLSRKVKDNLKDIAFALGLPLRGTNAELVSSIRSYLCDHPEYAQTRKFAGLYIPANGLELPVNMSAPLRDAVTASAPGPAAIPPPPPPTITVPTMPSHEAPTVNSTPSLYNNISPSCKRHSAVVDHDDENMPIARPKRRRLDSSLSSSCIDTVPSESSLCPEFTTAAWFSNGTPKTPVQTPRTERPTPVLTPTQLLRYYTDFVATSPDDLPSADLMTSESSTHNIPPPSHSYHYQPLRGITVPT